MGKQSRELGADPAKGNGFKDIPRKDGARRGVGAVSAPLVLSRMGSVSEQGQARLSEIAAGEEGQTIPN